MSNYFGVNADSVSTLFSSLSNSSSNPFTTSVLGEYSSIRNGSYKKLLTAYYEKNSETSSSTSTSADSTKTLANIKSDASALAESATKLEQFDYKTAKDAYVNVSQFVEEYNSVIESSDDSHSTSIQKYEESMKKFTAMNEELLNQIGITITSKDKLDLNQEQFDSASFSTIQSIFKGTGSYAYNIANRAMNISSAATLESSKSNTYSNTGSYTYNYSSGDIYSSLF